MTILYKLTDSTGVHDMNGRTITTILVAALLAAGCATQPVGLDYVPVVDLHGSGKDAINLQVDLHECRALAKAQRDNAAQQAFAGALAGALVGAIVAPRGYKSDLAARGAGLGALGGSAKAVDTQQDIIRRCIAGRGYRVLD